MIEIRNGVMAETEKDLDFEKLLSFLEYLQKIGWIAFPDIKEMN